VVDVYEPSERTEPLPPGIHVLSVLASVPNSGNQRTRTAGSSTTAFVPAAAPLKAGRCAPAIIS